MPRKKLREINFKDEELDKKLREIKSKEEEEAEYFKAETIKSGLQAKIHDENGKNQENTNSLLKSS